MFYVLLQLRSFWNLVTLWKKLNKVSNFVGLTGTSLSFTVHQKPPDLLINEYDLVRLECSQHVQSYNVILWYKQSGDQDLQLLGYLYRNNKYIESGLNREIKLDGDGASDAFLIMENVLTNDSAVYYCAARTHTVFKIPKKPYKKLTLDHVCMHAKWYGEIWGVMVSYSWSGETCWMSLWLNSGQINKEIRFPGK